MDRSNVFAEDRFIMFCHDFSESAVQSLFPPRRKNVMSVSQRQSSPRSNAVRMSIARSLGQAATDAIRIFLLACWGCILYQKHTVSGMRLHYEFTQALSRLGWHVEFQVL